MTAVAGGAASSSSNTTYIESASGVGEGARTGVASLVTAALFVLAIPFTVALNRLQRRLSLQGTGA